MRAYGSHREARKALCILRAPAILPLELLSSTFPLIESNASQFLTLLHISKQRMNLSRWTDLCALKNLRALFVHTGSDPPNFDERVANGWASHALEGGAFRHLHSLSLCTYCNDLITGQTMIHLLDLPKLKVLRLKGVRPVIHEDFDWKPAQYVRY